MSEALKPCPFCGGPAVIFDEGICYEAHCKCGIDLMIHAGDMDGAVAAWNRRAPSPSQEEALALVRKAALEEAARVAEGHDDDEECPGDCMERITAAIRALIEKDGDK